MVFSLKVSKIEMNYDPARISNIWHHLCFLCPNPWHFSFSVLTIYGQAALAQLRVAGDAATFVGAGRIAAELITGPWHAALIVVHATCRVNGLGHLSGRTIATCTLRRQFAIVTAVEGSASGILLICNYRWLSVWNDLWFGHWWWCWWHWWCQLTTMQLIVITIPVAVTKARQLDAGAVVAFTLKGATLGRNDIVTCQENGEKELQRFSEETIVSIVQPIFGYLQLVSSDMSPFPQSYSPSQSQARGMHFKLWPQWNCPSLHLGDLAARTQHSNHNNNNVNEDLWTVC